MIKGKNTYAVYIGLCVALLPVLLLRDFTPDNELRYLSIADEALRNNTFFTFTNHGVPYADKPPLYLWFVMLGKWLFGSHQMWFLSLFSLVPALVTVHVMDRWTGRSLNSEGHATARLMLLTCALFVGMAVTLRMDMLMCMFIVLALRSFFRLYSAQPENARTATYGVASGMTGTAVSAEAAAREKWLFPIYVFMAVFSKGPIGILVPLLAPTVFLIYKRRLRQFGRYWGWRTWVILIVLCAGWFGAVYAEGGNEYLDNLLFHQTLDRAVNAFHHERPFYFYAISVWYSIAPWSLAVIGLIVAAACSIQLPCNCCRFFTPIRIRCITYVDAFALVSQKFTVISPVTRTQVTVCHPLRHEFTYTILDACKIICTLSRRGIYRIQPEQIIFVHTDRACPPGAFVYCNPQREKSINPVLILILDK